jgi:hypothetical protein
MKYVRWALTFALLVVVWFHAHWSVASSLTLMAIAVELLVLVIRKAGRLDTR